MAKKGEGEKKNEFFLIQQETKMEGVSTSMPGDHIHHSHLWEGDSEEVVSHMVVLRCMGRHSDEEVVVPCSHKGHHKDGEVAGNHLYGNEVEECGVHNHRGRNNHGEKGENAPDNGHEDYIREGEIDGRSRRMGGIPHAE